MRLDDLVQEIHDVVRDATAGTLAPGWLPFAVTSERFVLELVARLYDGGFADPAWVRELLLDADRRFLEAVRTPALRPAPWRAAAEALEQDAQPQMRNLLLGICCHITYDLAVTLAPRLRIGDPAQLADFSRINEIISIVIDGVQAEIRAGAPGWLTLADASLSRTDEVATWAMFRWTRARAFDDGVRLARGDIDEDDLARTSLRLVRGLTLLPA
jgi:Family of unknown function (DUF5995)